MILLNLVTTYNIKCCFLMLSHKITNYNTTGIICGAGWAYTSGALEIKILQRFMLFKEFFELINQKQSAMERKSKMEKNYFPQIVILKTILTIENFIRTRCNNTEDITVHCKRQLIIFWVRCYSCKDQGTSRCRRSF